MDIHGGDADIEELKASVKQEARPNKKPKQRLREAASCGICKMSFVSVSNRNRHLRDKHHIGKDDDDGAEEEENIDAYINQKLILGPSLL